MSTSRLAQSTKIVAAAAALALGLATASQAQTHYSISTQESAFAYSMEHPMHSWSAVSRQARGEALIGPGFQSARIKVSIPVLSFDSGNSNRDSHMAEVVESYIYPEVIFQSTEVHLDSLQTSPEGSTRVVWKVKGALDFHGVSQPLECPVQLTVDKDKALAHGAFAVKLTDFALELPSLLGLKVKDDLQLSFDVAARSDGEPTSATSGPAEEGTGGQQAPEKN